MKGCELSTSPVASGDINWLVSSLCEGGACVAVARHNGDVLMRNTSNSAAPILRFMKQEWSDFIAGVKLGDFDEISFNCHNGF